MNRGFGYYFAKNIKAAAKTVLKGGNIFRYYVWFFAKLIGTFVPFLNAIFPVASVRMAKIAKTDGEISVIRSFGGVESWRSFGTVLLTMALKGLIFLGGLLVIAAVGVALGFLGAVIGTAAKMREPVLLAVVFAAPAAVAIVIYSFALVLLFAPTSYLLDSNSEKTGATATLTAAVETMRRGGKLTCFLNVCVPYVVIVAYLGAVSMFTFMLLSLFGGNIGKLVAIIWALVALAAFVALAPVFTLGSIMANNELFRDIALEPSALDNRVKGVFIKKASVNTLKSQGLDSDLLNLFDSAEKAEPVAKFTSYTEPGESARKVKTYENEADVPDAPPPQSNDSSELTSENEPQDEGGAKTLQDEQPASASEQYEWLAHETQTVVKPTPSGYESDEVSDAEIVLPDGDAADTER
jgi:hypothetical protein